MQDKSISRRDALKLAQLGTLLGAGLCISESAEAAPQDGATKLGRQSLVQMKENRLTVKLNVGNQLALLESPEIPRSVLEKIAGDNTVMFTWKCMRTAPGGKPETLYSDTIQIKWQRV
ncbi:hypothetical protein [Armatimonas rosea]|uniref:Uncharacterized protein n=1 Tax=Armatimonas rosea TaxID=685828 RepID=A0A7W9W938_ARMRO|nr:hypothetical protein [Armatimonas rosea]MBB6052232.1 hypothetical protein [Armatimonas rosea]